MGFGNSVAATMRNLGISQEYVARKAHRSQSRVSREINSQNMSPDFADTITKIINDPKLRAEYCEAYRAAMMPIPVLDKVDLHPMTVLDFCKEESREMGVAVDGARRILRNKSPEDALSDEEMGGLAQCTEQILDVSIAIQQFLIACAPWIDIEEMRRRMFEKMVDKGYRSSIDRRV